MQNKKVRALIGCLVIAAIGISHFTDCRSARNPGTANSKLYPFTENLLWGYIDSKGTVVIKPVYRSAYDFSEGLAAVRTGGLYGYINTKGKRVIAAQYDFAEAFDHGTARVYENGKPYIIDRSGKRLFDHNFDTIALFHQHQYTLAGTSSGKFCLIDRTGRMLTDTIFGMIFYENSYPITVSGWKSKPIPGLGYPYPDCGVIDSAGKWIVPEGKYLLIWPYREDRAIATMNDSAGHYPQCVLDKNGKELFFNAPQKWRFYDSYNDGLAIVECDAVNPHSDTYFGVVDTTGKLVFQSAWFIDPFSENRSFYYDRQSHFFLIDRKGKLIDSVPYSYTMYWGGNRDELPLFRDGKAFVRNDSNWLVIDTSGKVIYTAPEFATGVPWYHVGNNLVFDNNSVWNPYTGLSIPPQYSWVDLKTLDDELIRVGIDDTCWGYIDRAGKMIWKSKPPAGENLLPDIDYRTGSSFYAWSPYKKEFGRMYGGSYQSGWQFKTLPAEIPVQGKNLQLIIDPSKTIPWQNSFRGYAVYLANPGDSTFYFASDRYRLNIVLQAKNNSGQWTDLQYLEHTVWPSADQTLFLPAAGYWKFTMPDYSGSLQTKIRAMLLYKKTLQQNFSDTLYSNEISGTINPGQLWRNRSWDPSHVQDHLPGN